MIYRVLHRQVPGRYPGGETLPFRYVPLTVEVRINGTHGTDKRVSVIHYRYPSFSPPDTTTLNTLIDGVVAGPLSAMAQLCSNVTRWQSVVATDIAAAGGVSVSRQLSPQVVGAQTGDPLPGDVNFNLKKATNVVGKHRFGELFVPDLTEDHESDAFIDASYLGGAVNLAVQLLLHQAGMAPVVASKSRHNFYTITAIVFDNIVANLITRLINHRRHRRRH